MNLNFGLFSDKHLKIDSVKSAGIFGESVACHYLEKRKYRILKKNYREKFDEIDIIGESMDGFLVFFEVKTMIYSTADLENMLDPEDNFTIAKFKKIKRLCEMFVAKHRKISGKEITWRIDLLAIEIKLNKDKILIKHYKNVYK
jgi:putative endonuclease